MEPATKRGRAAVRVLIGRLAGQAGRRHIQRVRLLLHLVLGEHDAGATEAIRFNDVGAGLQVGTMDSQDDIGPCLHQVLVAALERRTTEIGGCQVLLLEHGPHGSVNDENTGCEGVE